MRYLYMDNFRGFSGTLVPLKQINFLVGENSSGKSSFLSLLNLANQPLFWLDPTHVFLSDSVWTSFGDIVSAWSDDKSRFRVGVVKTLEKESLFTLSFSVHVYSDQNDSPKLIRHLGLSDGKLYAIDFEKPNARYSLSSFEEIFKTEAKALAAFPKLIESLMGVNVALKTLRQVGSDYPLSLVISLLRTAEKEKNSRNIRPDLVMPMANKVTWIAPIRSKPKRIYEAQNLSYSPEGEHIPLLLRKTMRGGRKSTSFASKLAAFGDASGLFETVKAHTFGQGAKNPFELLVRFKGAELNINNVGYGVSQALPLIVEFLTATTPKLFAVQQPEVHLHPRAQAALGGLIFELAKEAQHGFFIETHSDYLIDRYRLAMGTAASSPPSQVLFFLRTATGNVVHPLIIEKNGRYPQQQPREFREFFVKEEMKLLDL